VIGDVAFTLPLGTLITEREARQMDRVTMGVLFRHETVKVSGGILMLFNDPTVQRWGMRRITELRTIHPRGGCSSCGWRGDGLRSRESEVLCPACYRQCEDELQASNELEAGVRRLIRRHARRWQGGRSLSELIGNDGNWLIDLVGEISVELIEAELYAEDAL